jgi:EmrB/QacA subfamily drug resistance transporter
VFDNLERGWKVLMVTSVGVYLVSLDVTVVNIAFPALSEEFADTSRNTLSWVLSGYNIAFAAALLSAGRIADRFGRRRIFYAGITAFTISSVACGLAPSAALLIAARVTQAVGGALVVPSSLALVLPEFPPNRRSAAIGISGSVGGIAAATGPSLGSVLVQSVSWRAVFFINVPLVVAAWLFGRRLLRESKDPAAAGLPDVLGGVLASASVGLLALAIVQGDDWGYDDPRIVAALAGFGVLLPLFLLRCARNPDPVLDLRLLRERYFVTANSAAFLFALGFFAMLFVNIQFTTGVWGYSIVGAGLAATPGPLCAALTAGPGGRLADRFGHRFVIVPGTAMFAAGILGLVAFVPAEPRYWAILFPANVATGLGVGLTFSTLGSAANAYLPPNRFAMGSAFNATCRQIGAALGIAVAVAILGRPGSPGFVESFDTAWTFVAAMAIAAGLVILLAYKRPAGAPEPDVELVPVVSTD